MEAASDKDLEATSYVVDRTGWRAGPWDTEPDYVHWVDAESGLDCFVVRGPKGALCGYVGLAEGHRFYGKDWQGLEVAVHGGLSYSAKNGGLWWLGFDCARAYDFQPGYGALQKLTRRRERAYKDVEYVKAECAKLAKQLVMSDE